MFILLFQTSSKIFRSFQNPEWRRNQQNCSNIFYGILHFRFTQSLLIPTTATTFSLTRTGSKVRTFHFDTILDTIFQHNTTQKTKMYYCYDSVTVILFFIAMRRFIFGAAKSGKHSDWMNGGSNKLTVDAAGR